MTVPTVAVGESIAVAWGNGVAGEVNSLLSRANTQEAQWTDFTPTFTGITLGNGTATGRYLPHGMTRVAHLTLVLGSTTVIGANPSFTPPGNLHNAHGCRGLAIQYHDTSAGTPAGMFLGIPIVNTTGDVRLGYHNVSGTAIRAAAITNALPFVWATGDRIDILGIYERSGA